MLIVDLPRESLYSAVGSQLERNMLRKIGLEIGVLRGDNAEQIQKYFKPEHLYLLDPFSAKAIKDAMYSRENRSSWLRPPETLANYFGGSIFLQDTFDALHDMVVKRFSAQENVSIIRSDSSTWRAHLPLKAVSYVYIDGSHQYEDVLDDLIAVHNFAADDCVIQLNDCWVSTTSHKQNIGVLEAVNHFIKIYRWRTIALTIKDHDLIIARGRVGELDSWRNILDLNKTNYISMPSALLGCCYTDPHGNLSFGD